MNDIAGGINNQLNFLDPAQESYLYEVIEKENLGCELLHHEDVDSLINYIKNFFIEEVVFDKPRSSFRYMFNSKMFVDHKEKLYEFLKRLYLDNIHAKFLGFGHDRQIKTPLWYFRFWYQKSNFDNKNSFDFRKLIEQHKLSKNKPTEITVSLNIDDFIPTTSNCQEEKKLDTRLQLTDSEVNIINTQLQPTDSEVNIINTQLQPTDSEVKTNNKQNIKSKKYFSRQERLLFNIEQVKEQITKGIDSIKNYDRLMYLNNKKQKADEFNQRKKAKQQLYKVIGRSCYCDRKFNKKNKFKEISLDLTKKYVDEIFDGSKLTKCIDVRLLIYSYVYTDPVAIAKTTKPKNIEQRNPATPRLKKILGKTYAQISVLPIDNIEKMLKKMEKYAEWRFIRSCKRSNFNNAMILRDKLTPWLAFIADKIDASNIYKIKLPFETLKDFITEYEKKICDKYLGEEVTYYFSTIAKKPFPFNEIMRYFVEYHRETINSGVAQHIAVFKQNNNDYLNLRRLLEDANMAANINGNIDNN